MTEDKYNARAERWSEIAYADAATYLAHRGELVLKLGPPLAHAVRLRNGVRVRDHDVLATCRGDALVDVGREAECMLVLQYVCVT